MEKLYQDTPDNEREAMLEANCVRPEEKMVKRHFTHTEITDQRKQFLDNCVIIRRAVEKLNIAKDIFKQETSGVSNENEYLLNNIRSGFVEMKQQVYLFDDQEKGVMNYYDSRGEFLESRRLTPEERQTRIHN